MTTDESQLRHKVHLQCACCDSRRVPSRFIVVAGDGSAVLSANPALFEWFQ
jgi:hypothetical protein